MTLVTYNGPGRVFTLARLTFRKGEARPVPAEAIEILRAHPWFHVEAPEAEAEPEQPRRRGRPRKDRTQ